MYRNAFEKRKKRDATDPVSARQNQTQKEIMMVEQSKVLDLVNPFSAEFDPSVPYQAPPLRLQGVDLNDLLRRS